MAQPKAIYIYLENEEKLNTLTDAQRGRLLSAVLAYGNRGETPDFSDDPVLAYAFLDLKSGIDRDNERYNDTCKRRAESGKKGGQAKQANATFATNDVAKPSKSSEKEIEAEVEVEVEVEDIASAISSARAHEDFDVRAQRVINLFKKTCPTIVHPLGLTDHRRRLIYDAEKDGVNFELLFSKLRASPFLYGKPGIGFDWVLEPKNRQKVLEGNYDRERKKSKGSVYTADSASLSDYGKKVLFDD